MLSTEGGSDFRGIVIVEVMWKKVSGIMNLRLTLAIYFHYTIHSFFPSQGTGTASLESNLLQKRITMIEEIQYDNYLYLHKSYGDLDRYTCLETMSGYGM